MSGIVIGTCPACGDRRPLAEYLQDLAQRQARAAALALDSRLAPAVLDYLNLYAKPGKRVTAPTFLRVLRELHELVMSGQVTHDRVTHPAPVDYWMEGLVATARSATPPLEGNGYLVKTVWGIAAKAATRQDRDREQALQSHRPDGQTNVDKEARRATTDRRIQVAELREQLHTLRRLPGSPENEARIQRVTNQLADLGADPDAPAGGTSVVTPPEGLHALAANAPPEAREGLKKLSTALGNLRRPLTNKETSS